MPKLSDVARHLIVPDGIVTSGWPAVERRLQSVEVHFDRWQQGFAAAALGRRKDGKYAATIGGVVASIPRQVGKTFTVGHMLIGLALEHANMRIIWTSHHARTTTNTFRSMQGMVGRPKMAPLIAPNGIRVANGEQEIRFRNGSVVMFGAREHGFGRGLDAIDIEVFDEAQILSLKALEDMVPATNQAKHVHGALVFFLGTPPRKSDAGAAFTAKRAAAIEGRTTDQVYVELSADPDAKWDDRKQWARMNPSFPARTPVESMLRMRENVPDDDSWRREAMGIWTETDNAAPWRVIPKQAWEAASWCTGLVGDITLALEVSQDFAWSTIVAAASSGQAGDAVELVDHAEGTDWIVGRLADLCAKHGARGVVIDARSPAAAFAEALGAVGVNVITPKVAEVVQAAGAMFVGVVEGGVSVVPGAAPLDHAVAWADKRTAGDAWVVDRRVPELVGPLIACTLALWGHRRPVEVMSEADFIVL